MAVENFTETIDSLTSEEQEAVVLFVAFLRRKGATTEESAFVSAAREFMEEHPDLLRRLAQ